MTKAEARALARITAERDRLQEEHKRQSAIIRNLVHEVTTLRIALCAIRDAVEEVKGDL